ncbi:TPR-like protein [Trichodelitschia bisporula]|uniref:TPR-like protein n=1 Tax=Trichodelitschia bisporula TaxID=703511 RepID=A0A6G1I7R7_9PEZI|nr:TPR-like protein [Trichodelitschia bisporula]
MAASNGIKLRNERFADIPLALDIPVLDAEEEAVEVNLTELQEDHTELCTLLEMENVARQYWMTVALAYAKQSKVDQAVEIVLKAVKVKTDPEDRVSLLHAAVWMCLSKCREAPREARSDAALMDAPAFYASKRSANNSNEGIKTKDDYLREATGHMNEISRISPSFPQLYLTRGMVSLLRSTLVHPNERAGALKSALNDFETALRVSHQNNIMALLGKARVYFALGRYQESLQVYQLAIQRAPRMTEPDPRIGLGCCLWQLGHIEEAKLAWERALELNPESKFANILMGLYYLHSSAQFSSSDPRFTQAYKKAMVVFAQKAFKLDENTPLTLATFGGYYLMRKNKPFVEKLAWRAIRYCDVPEIASDGYYLLARMAHYEKDYPQAWLYYQRADETRGGDGRGGDDQGHTAAKFGMAQLKVILKDTVDAKFRLDKLVRQTKSVESMSLLGNLYAEEYFAEQRENPKATKTDAWKKAVSLLEQVRLAWKDTKKNLTPDANVLLLLARLYETDTPGQSLQCLLQVEQLELEKMGDDKRPEGVEDEAAIKKAMRQHLPPQLLNNIGSFYYLADRFSEAQNAFETALSACVRIAEEDKTADTDALVTTISYNLGRTYEAEAKLDEAKTVYTKLLDQHPGYLEASARSAFISLLQDPSGSGPKAVTKVFQSAPDNLEVRALYGWYLNKSKKRTSNPAEDQEQRHLKHTLKDYNKHDLYSLTTMGNLHLVIAREMPRQTEQDKDRRRKMYAKAVEFFAKALQLDPHNAYAAQGIAISIIEDKKELGKAIQIFMKLREVLKDSSVSLNLGHAFCEQKQYPRAIEHYENALAKEKSRDYTTLSCLGRVWMLRGKSEKSLDAMKSSLDCARRALAISPAQIHFRFNVAYAQFQIAQILNTIPPQGRSMEDLETALVDLDAAVETLAEIAKSPNPPFPRQDLEQRAAMGRSTMRSQLERLIQEQRTYEGKHAERLAEARKIREDEIQKLEEKKRLLAEKESEKEKRLLQEHREMQIRDREITEKRVQYEATLPRKEKGKRKKDDDHIDSDGEGDHNYSSEAPSRGRRSRGTSAPTDGKDKPRKKRRLERRPKAQKAEKPNKYKSSELVGDSDLDEDENDGLANGNGDANGNGNGDASDDDAVAQPRKKAQRVISDDDDEDVAMEDVAAGGGDDSE